MLGWLWGALAGHRELGDAVFAGLRAREGGCLLGWGGLRWGGGVRSVEGGFAGSERLWGDHAERLGVAGAGLLLGLGRAVAVAGRSLLVLAGLLELARLSVLSGLARQTGGTGL
ncbi:hypothetical protein [Acrocarpospora pleiomorpha]|uniref:hypothetical protein n=1 Tax=Acrocarpospora pleiomorpha TaxID=90975 RepID=UPI0012D2A853|nr:hypothetical protein [Acrocarpospora pleiomorpha]